MTPEQLESRQVADGTVRPMPACSSEQLDEFRQLADLEAEYPILVGRAAVAYMKATGQPFPRPWLLDGLLAAAAAAVTVVVLAIGLNLAAWVSAVGAFVAVFGYRLLTRALGFGHS